MEYRTKLFVGGAVSWTVLAFCASLVCIGCAGTAHRVGTSASGPIPTDCFSQTGYVAFPGDVLEVLCLRDASPIDSQVVQIEDVIATRFPSLDTYSLTQPVKRDGTINLPQIASFRIAGLTIKEAHRRISALYKNKGWEPEFFLAIEQFDSRPKEVERFWNAHDADRRQVTVRPDGFARFPMIGDIPVAGKTVGAIAQDVRARYAKKYPGLDFDVTLTQANADKVFIFGEVRAPGAYSLGQTGSLYELLARAGGPLNTARLSATVIMRVDGTVMQCERINANRALRGWEAGADVRLCPGTIVYVPRRVIVSVAELTRMLADIVFFRGFAVGFTWRLEEIFDFNTAE